MIEFDSQTNFVLEDQLRFQRWIQDIIHSEGYKVGEILYIFCDDEYLHKLNVEFLGHNTLTDILTFDYNLGKEVNSEIYISIPRVKENAIEFGVSFAHELNRVMIHGILHLCGYNDETAQEKHDMRSKEDGALLQLSKIEG